MDINMIKATIATITGKPLLSLDMSRQLDVDKKPTQWYSYWDNDNRIRVVMHEDIFAKLKADKTAVTGLALKPVAIVVPDGKPSYMRFVVITPNIEASF